MTSTSTDVTTQTPSRHGRWHLVDSTKAEQILRAPKVAHPYLVIVLEDGRALTTVLGPGARLTVGRSSEADLPLNWDATVSSVHAVVRRDLDLLTVDDPGPSRNGTWVNGAKVEARVRLEDRDILLCGETEVLVRCPMVAGGSGTVAMAPRVDWKVLSPTERRVVLALLELWPTERRLLRAPSTEELASFLSLGESTVKSHLQSVFRKLRAFGVAPDRGSLAAIATGAEQAIREIDSPLR